MAKVKVRYFVKLRGAEGPRYFWQPSGTLRELGWKSERLPEDLTAAIARAQQLNAELDAWRKGEPAPQAETTRPKATPRKGAPQHGTISHLIQLYRQSRFYPTNPKTQRSYEQNLRVIEGWAGDATVAAIGPKRVQKLYDGLRVKTPSKANAVITMLRILLSHGVREQIIRTNAAEKPGLISQPFSGKLWPRDAVDLFVEVADRAGLHSVGTAVVINHWLGQRQADVLTMKRAAYRNGILHVTQRKTNARVEVPHSPMVEARIEAELDRQKARKIETTPEAALLLCETTGAPWKEDHFRHVFAEIRETTAEKWGVFFLDDGSSVNMLELQFMHLRHTAITRLAIAGCTPLEIAGITGHTIKSVEQILDRYLVRTSDLAAAAAAKRLAYDAAIEAEDQAATPHGERS